MYDQELEIDETLRITAVIGNSTKVFQLTIYSAIFI